MPYCDPFWEAVASQPGIELDVYYCAGRTGDRPLDVNWSFGFQGAVMRGANLLAWRGIERACFRNSGLRQRLSQGGAETNLTAVDPGCGIEWLILFSVQALADRPA